MLGHAFESRAPTLFYSSTRKFFTISFKFLDFLRSLDRFKVLITVIISEFNIILIIWLGEKISLKYFFLGVIEERTFDLKKLYWLGEVNPSKNYFAATMNLVNEWVDNRLQWNLTDYPYDRIQLQG